MGAGRPLGNIASAPALDGGRATAAKHIPLNLLLNSQAILLGCHSEPLAKLKSCQTIGSSGPCPV